MSANNFIEINRRTFEVHNLDIDTGKGYLVGKGESLEDAIDLANEELFVEYGIHFTEK